MRAGEQVVFLVSEHRGEIERTQLDALDAQRDRAAAGHDAEGV